MKLYHYDKNGEFTHQSTARPNPREDGFLIPNRATTEPPPKAEKGKVVVWNNGWEQSEDHRGKTVYSVADKTRRPVNKPGPIPEGYTEEAPPSHRHEWDGSAWVLDDDIKAEIEAEETRDALAATDKDMARVAEDIIGLLIDKGVFTAEELPESVREKIQAREALRQAIIQKTDR